MSKQNQAERIAQFIAIFGDSLTGPCVVKGKWATWASALTWAQIADRVKAAKDAGFKSVFYRGHRVGIRADVLRGETTGDKRVKAATAEPRTQTAAEILAAIAG